MQTLLLLIALMQNPTCHIDTDRAPAPARPVPEPMTLSLIGLGGVGALYASRKNKDKNNES